MRQYDYLELEKHKPFLEKEPRGEYSELSNMSVGILKINQLYSVSQKIRLLPRNIKVLK